MESAQERVHGSNLGGVPIYLVHYTSKLPDTQIWESFPFVELKDVVTGESPALQTSVRLCWSNYALHLQFRCEDDVIVSPYTRRDDPLYDADVVEWFIEPQQQEEQRYYEFNISPHNVLFDSLITYEEGKPKHFQPEWNAEGITTQVRYLERNPVTNKVVVEYTATLPFSDVNVIPPHPGDEWKLNLFRIDEDEAGERSYSAWSPTGAVQFHRPERFGTIRFYKG